LKVKNKMKYTESELLSKVYNYLNINKLLQDENIFRVDIDRLFFKLNDYLLKKENNTGTIAYIDGSSIGNPGHAGIGHVITDTNGNIIEENYKYIGIKTNNEAEYEALICLLNYLLTNNIKIDKVFSDSLLLVNQLQGKYKVKSNNIKPLYLQTHNLLKNFSDLKIEYIERKYNLADKLARKASELKISKNGD